MASIPLTLAALASSAVPGLKVTGVQLHDDGADFVSVAIETDRGDALVQIPRTEAAEVRQSAELLGLAALSEGSRTVLPFTVPESMGMTRAGDTRAVVFTRLKGARFSVADLSEEALLVEQIAGVLAAIHDLPASVVQQGGLPVHDARAARSSASRVLERAADTRMLPETVLQRWDHTVETDELWDFAPTVVHGSLDADRLLVEEDRVRGVEGWSDLGVGDPALDFAWLLGADPAVIDSVIPRYARLRSVGSLPSLRARAQLYHELALARQLLHGVETHDQALVDAAIADLDGLVDSLSSTLPAAPSAVLGKEQVEHILSETPEVADRLSDTAAYEALDEDRQFAIDTDFVDPLPAADGTEAPEPAVSADQPTEPLSNEDLPTTDRD